MSIRQVVMEELRHTHTDKIAIYVYYINVHCSTLFRLGLQQRKAVGAWAYELKSIWGAPNFCPKNLSLQLNIAQKNFQHIIYGNGIKITNFGPQMLIAKVKSLRNKMVLPKNGQINRIALRVAFFKAHFYFSNLLWHIV